jgi:hypothetical protein
LQIGILDTKEVFKKVVGTSFTEMFAAYDWKPFQSCLASNLLAHFSHQIVVQIIGIVSPKVYGNLAICPL